MIAWQHGIRGKGGNCRVTSKWNHLTGAGRQTD